MQHDHLGSFTPADSFPTDPTGLPEARQPQVLELADGTPWSCASARWPSR
jgi:hypothetical protein